MYVWGKNKNPSRRYRHAVTYVRLPSAGEREDVLRMHVHVMRLGPEVDLAAVAADARAAQFTDSASRTLRDSKPPDAEATVAARKLRGSRECFEAEVAALTVILALAAAVYSAARLLASETAAAAAAAHAAGTLSVPWPAD